MGPPFRAMSLSPSPGSFKAAPADFPQQIIQCWIDPIVEGKIESILKGQISDMPMIVYCLTVSCL